MKDRFSSDPESYARFRPDYPSELYDFILARVETKQKAWDCGTGNGQTAIVLAQYFDNVFATDISKEQLRHAHPAPNITYSQQPAEKTSFPDNYFDLITVSQALHWFSFDDFYKEVERVGKEGAWIAAWMYGLPAISPAIDKWIMEFYTLLSPFWDTERKYVEERYGTLPFPFPEIASPVFIIRAQWNLQQLEGYLNTWSAFKEFQKTNKANPIEKIIHQTRYELHQEELELQFPVHLRMGQVTKGQ